MTRCSHLQRETAGSLSHGVPFTFVFVPTSSTRIGWSTSAFLSAIEVFPPIRSLSQRAVLLRCAVAFLVLESTTFKSVVGALNTEYVSSRSRVSVSLSKFSRQSGTCRGCMETDITSLRQDILIFLLSALPVLSQTSTLRLWIVCSSVSLHCGLQTEFTFVSLSVISSLTTGLCSGTTSATEQHRNVGSKDAQFATHMPSKELQKKKDTGRKVPGRLSACRWSRPVHFQSFIVIALYTALMLSSHQMHDTYTAQSMLHRRVLDRMTHRTSFGSDAFLCGFFWAQVVDSAHMSSSSDAILEADGTFRTDTPHRHSTTTIHTTMHTHNHGQSQGQQHKGTLSRRTELGASK